MTGLGCLCQSCRAVAGPHVNFGGIWGQKPRPSSTAVGGRVARRMPLGKASSIGISTWPPTVLRALGLVTPDQPLMESSSTHCFLQPHATCLPSIPRGVAHPKVVPNTALPAGLASVPRRTVLAQTPAILQRPQKGPAAISGGLACPHGPAWNPSCFHLPPGLQGLSPYSASCRLHHDPACPTPLHP